MSIALTERTSTPPELIPLFDPALSAILSGKRVVVTGATRGVGRLICLLLALHGASVASGDIVVPENTRVECEQVVELKKRKGLGGKEDEGEEQKMVAIRFDAGLSGSSRALIEEAEAKLGSKGLDHLILCHTLPEYSSMLDPDTDLLGRARKHAEVNYLGYVEAAVAALPFLRRNAEERLKEVKEKGDKRTVLQRLLGLFSSELSPNSANYQHLLAKSGITVISSLSSRVPFPFTHGYAASKAAIESWFACLALELGLAGLPVSISCVTFAAVRTQVLVDALVKTQNYKALSQAADPVDAALCVIRSGVLGKEDTVFPGNVGVIRTLYAVLPGVARWLISLFDGDGPSGPEKKMVEGKKED